MSNVFSPAVLKKSFILLSVAVTLACASAGVAQAANAGGHRYLWLDRLCASDPG